MGSGDKFIESLYLETNELASVNDLFDNQEEDSSFVENIVYIELHFTNGMVQKHYLYWFCDYSFGDNYLQRSFEDNNLYGFSFDFTQLTNNYFKTYAIEELVKFYLDLPYNHILTDSDIEKIDILDLFFDEILFVDYENIEPDILKLTSLKELYLTFNDLDTNNTTIDLTNLGDLPLLTNVWIEARKISIIGLEELAKKKVTVELKIENHEDYEHLKKIFKDNGASLKVSKE